MDNDQQRIGESGIGDQGAVNAEPKHTPGPWSYTFRNGNYSEGEVSANNGKNTIAIVAGQNYGQWRDADDNGDAEFKANARLIAAAPDLLAAAKMALDCAQSLNDEMTAAYAALHVAVRKAEPK